MSSYEEIAAEAIASQEPEEAPFEAEPAMFDEDGNELEYVYTEDPNQYEYHEQPVQYDPLIAAEAELVRSFQAIQTPSQYQSLQNEISAMSRLVSNSPGAIAYQNEQQADLAAQIHRGFELIDEKLDAHAEASGARIGDHVQARNLAEELNQKANAAAAREGRPYDPETVAEWAIAAAAKEATGNRTYKDVVDKYQTITGGSTVQPGARKKWA